MPLVSVVVPLYNAERHIAACIESVLNQSHPDWELLIVDDGSTDRSVEIVAQYAQRDERIRVLCHEQATNRGVSVTRRKGIEQSRGQYVALLDADDVFEPHKLERQLLSAARHPQCVVYHCGARCVDTQGAAIAGPNWADAFNAFARQERVYSFRDDENFLLCNSVLNSSALIRATALQQLPFAFEQLFQYEDWTLWVLLSGQGSFYVQPDTLVQYRVHDECATTKVVQSPLVAIYSHIEFLLSVVALTNDRQIRRRCAAALEAKLAEAVCQYRQVCGSAGPSDHFAANLDANFLAGTEQRGHRKWYRRLLRRVA